MNEKLERNEAANSYGTVVKIYFSELNERKKQINPTQKSG